MTRIEMFLHCLSAMCMFRLTFKQPQQRTNEHNNNKKKLVVFVTSYKKDNSANVPVNLFSHTSPKYIYIPSIYMKIDGWIQFILEWKGLMNNQINMLEFKEEEEE